MRSRDPTGCIVLVTNTLLETNSAAETSETSATNQPAASRCAAAAAFKRTCANDGASANRAVTDDSAGTNRAFIDAASDAVENTARIRRSRYAAANQGRNLMIGLHLFLGDVNF